MVATITVNAAIPPVAHAKRQEDNYGRTKNIYPRQLLGGRGGTSTTYWPQPVITTPPSQDATSSEAIDNPGQCSFFIPGGIQLEMRWTEYICTFTEEALLNGALYTVRFTSTTHLLPNEPLRLGTFLDIERFVLQTKGTAGLTSVDDYMLSGRLTQSSTFTAETTITAFPIGICLPPIAPSTTPISWNHLRSLWSANPPSMTDVNNAELEVVVRQAHIESLAAELALPQSVLPALTIIPAGPLKEPPWTLADPGADMVDRQAHTETSASALSEPPNRLLQPEFSTHFVARQSPHTEFPVKTLVPVPSGLPGSSTVPEGSMIQSLASTLLKEQR